MMLLVSDDALNRYKVSFLSANTGIDKWTRYSVVTWKGERKAIALAAMAHGARHPRTGIYEVAVEMGRPVESESDGENFPIIEGSELVDRMEW